jgi:hypothetical protein
MTLVVVLNILFAAFVVVGICSLLGWSIHRSRQARLAVATARPGREARASRAAAPRRRELRPFPQ